ncbi:MAG: hypothetical protein ACRC6I_01870 [Paracoccaceae bacterium]
MSDMTVERAEQLLVLSGSYEWCYEPSETLDFMRAGLTAYIAAEERHESDRAELSRLTAELEHVAVELAGLREAATALRDDMMERAEFRMDVISGEQYRIVNAGNSAWANFCAALNPKPEGEKT